jgi:hypothetical protein
MPAQLEVAEPVAANRFTWDVQFATLRPPSLAIVAQASAEHLEPGNAALVAEVKDRVAKRQRLMERRDIDVLLKVLLVARDVLAVGVVAAHEPTACRVGQSAR